MIDLPGVSVIRGALSRVPPRLVAPGKRERRAAIVMILRPTDAGPEALFVRRAEVVGDPWSGHMALPGGHRDPGDTDLIDTARRETLEEVGVPLERADFLGRLDDIHPLGRGLPSIVVSPFVAWRAVSHEVRTNHEVQYHHWIPLATLADPAARSELTWNRHGEKRVFPSIVFAGDTIWGLTHRVVINFLEILGEEPSP